MSTVEERLGSLSASRAADFVQCPLMYRYKVIDRFPTETTLAQVQGTLVHAVLERIFDLPAPDRTVAAAKDLLGPEWERLRAEDPEVAALFDTDPPATAERLVERWFTVEDPNRLEPAHREGKFEVHLASGLLLRGYIDRVDVAPDPSHKVRIVDYKSGKSPHPRFRDKAMFQMRFYALAWWRQHGVIPARLMLIYLRDGATLVYDPDEADLLATEQRIHDLWQAIRRAATTGQWDPKPSKLCGWCDFRDLCPEYGGTPPPLEPIRLDQGEVDWQEAAF